MGAPPLPGHRSLERSKASDLWHVVPRLCEPHEELGQAVDLIVVPATRELQDLGLEVLQPPSRRGGRRDPRGDPGRRRGPARGTPRGAPRQGRRGSRGGRRQSPGGGRGGSAPRPSWSPASRRSAGPRLPRTCRPATLRRWRTVLRPRSSRCLMISASVAELRAGSRHSRSTAAPMRRPFGSAAS